MKSSGTKEILGRYTDRHLTMWVVTMRNIGEVKVSVSESAALYAMQQYAPIPAKEAAIFVEGNIKLSRLATTARLFEHAGRLTLVIATNGIAELGEKVVAGLALFNQNVPHITAALRGRDVPAMQNFMRLAWLESIDLDPGATAASFIFTDKQEKPHYNSFRLELPTTSTMVIR